MKKNILITGILAFSCSIFLLNSCKKDDTTAPDVKLNGLASMEISLNSAAPADPGATANDNEDGSISSVTSTWSSTNPDVNHTGTYTITYSAVDKAGNTGTANRTVRVKNDAENFAGTYAVHDTCPGVHFDYAQTISVDETLNNRLHFDKFANYAGNTHIYATKLANGTLDMPSQTAASIGSGPNTCDVADHRFTSNLSSNISNGFVLVYTDEIISPSTCTGSTVCTATFTK